VRRSIGKVVLWVVVISTIAFSQATAQVQVDFVPSTVNLSLGQRALVAVELTGVPVGGLAAFQLDLGFDPIPIDLLNPNEAFRGTIDPFAPLGNNALCTTVRGTPTCDDPDWFLITTARTPLGSDSIDNAAGRIRVAYGSYGAGAPPEGNGAIGLIEVFGEYNGTVAVTFTGVILADDQEPPIEYTTVLGSLTVVVGTGIANIPPQLSAIGDQSTFERIPLNVPLSSSDSDGNALTLSTTGLPAFCSLNDNGDGSGSIDCTPVVGDSGVYPITVSATDDGMPNRVSAEVLTITIQATNCTDVDLDGFGAPGDISCPNGTQTDCDDLVAAVNPSALELCRNGIDDDCDSLIDVQEAACPSSTCIVITLGAPATDPSITFDDALACPPPLGLARSIDLIWGDLTAVGIVGSDIKVGTVNQVVCVHFDDTQSFDNLRPDEGQIDFFLARESGQPTYGSNSGGLPRTPDAGDCP
jgi:hypothetical protein